MEKSGSKGNNQVGSSDGTLEDIDTSEVVLRRPRNSIGLDNENETTEDGKKQGKKVKWSECTELREKMKVCRRSQLDIPLDYHHIAVDEEIEREGVKHWRQHVKKDGEGPNISPLAVTQANSTTTTPRDSRRKDGKDAGSDGDSSDDGDYNPCCVEDLDRKLHAINVKSNKYTTYPTYCAAIPVFEEWLSNNAKTKGISDEEKTVMKSQLNLYKKIVEIYENSLDTDDPSVIESEFAKIASYLQEIERMGSLPSCVPVAISQALTADENVIESTDL